MNNASVLIEKSGSKATLRIVTQPPLGQWGCLHFNFVVRNGERLNTGEINILIKRENRYVV